MAGYHSFFAHKCIMYFIRTIDVKDKFSDFIVPDILSDVSYNEYRSASYTYDTDLKKPEYCIASVWYWFRPCRQGCLLSNRRALLCSASTTAHLYN